MPLRIIEISAPDKRHAAIKKLAEKHEAIDYWYSARNKDGRRSTQILVHLNHQQALMDELQKEMHKEDHWRLIVLPVESTLPENRQTENESDDGKKPSRPSITREALYNEVIKNAEADSNFILLVFLSTIVCAIGLLNNNIAVVIGAMVIAPLLGPNLALTLGAALGDKDLMTKALKTNAAGLSLTIGLSVIVGLLFSNGNTSYELISRATVGYDALLLAFASGAAAVLSLTTGLSTALVGVMVAVALMPPAVAMGVFIGDGTLRLAYGASLLLASNIVCVSLAAQIVFLVKGIKPRTWYMRRKSKQSVTRTTIFWIIMLLTLIALIAINQKI